MCVMYVCVFIYIYIYIYIYVSCFRKMLGTSISVCSVLQERSVRPLRARRVADYRGWAFARGHLDSRSSHGSQMQEVWGSNPRLAGYG